MANREDKRAAAQLRARFQPTRRPQRTPHHGGNGVRKNGGLELEERECFLDVSYAVCAHADPQRLGDVEDAATLILR